VSTPVHAGAQRRELRHYHVPSFAASLNGALVPTILFAVGARKGRFEGVVLQCSARSAAVRFKQQARGALLTLTALGSCT
jgi:hypothetical protein